MYNILIKFACFQMYLYSRTRRFSFGRAEKGEMSANVEMYNRSSFLDKCWNCPLGGYCGGGCSVSTHVDQSRFCQEEQKNFEYLVQEVILPIVWSKFNGVSE